MLDIAINTLILSAMLLSSVAGGLCIARERPFRIPNLLFLVFYVSVVALGVARFVEAVASYVDA